VALGRATSFSEVQEDGCRLIPLEPRPLESPVGRPIAVGRSDPGLEEDYERPAGAEPHVVVLPEAIVLNGDGLVRTAGGTLVTEGAWRKRLVEQLVERRWVRAPIRLRGTYGSVVTNWGENYCHWLVDGIPRYALLEEAGLGDLPLLVSGPLNRVRRQVLEQLGVDPERAVAVERRAVQPDSLAWASPLSWGADPLPWTCFWLRDRLAPPAGDGTRTERILVSRAGSAWRRVTNEAELARELEPLGFVSVRLEQLTFAEQARLFSRATVVVAPHGAGLTNVVFGRDLSVVEFFPPDWVQPVYKRLSLAAGHRYAYAIGETPPGSTALPPHQDVVAPIEAIVSYLDSVPEPRPTS
jgi:capsular polysaccharide biosynthesis protein